MSVVSLSGPGHEIASPFAQSTETLRALETRSLPGFDIPTAVPSSCQEDQSSPDPIDASCQELPFSPIFPNETSARRLHVMAMTELAKVRRMGGSVLRSHLD